MLDIGQKISFNDSENSVGFLPNEIFHCKSLVSLKLFIGRRSIKVQEHVDLPILKELSLCFDPYVIPSMIAKSLHNLFPGCPMLEDLCIDIEKGWSSGVPVIYISIPSLKRLKLKLDLGCEGPDFIVDTPNLVHFDYIFRVHKKIEMKNPNCLVSAHFTILDAKCLTEGFSSSIFGISRVKSLSLKMHGRLGCSFPEFPLLKYLELHGVTHDFHESLFGILPSTPAVEFLVIDMSYGGKDIDYKAWLNTPICLSQSVKEVEFRNLYGSLNDFGLVKYILQYGKALTRMTIHFSEEMHQSGCELIALVMSSRICPKDRVYIKKKKLPSSDELRIISIIIQVAGS